MDVAPRITQTPPTILLVRQAPTHLPFSLSVPRYFRPRESICKYREHPIMKTEETSADTGVRASAAGARAAWLIWRLNDRLKKKNSLNNRSKNRAALGEPWSWDIICQPERTRVGEVHQKVETLANSGVQVSGCGVYSLSVTSTSRCETLTGTPRYSNLIIISLPEITPVRRLHFCFRCF